VKFAAHFTREDDGWVVEIPEAGGGGIATQGDTLEEAREMARDAVTEVLLAQLDQDQALSNGPNKLPKGLGWEWVLPYQTAWTAIQVLQARKSKGLTIAQAAELCGVSGPTYVRWEDPYKGNATVKTLEKVATALGKHLEVVLH